jgi:hypothetical protein
VYDKQSEMRQNLHDGLTSGGFGCGRSDELEDGGSDKGGGGAASVNLFGGSGGTNLVDDLVSGGSGSISGSLDGAGRGGGRNGGSELKIVSGGDFRSDGFVGRFAE